MHQLLETLTANTGMDHEVLALARGALQVSASSFAASWVAAPQFSQLRT